MQKQRRLNTIRDMCIPRKLRRRELQEDLQSLSTALNSDEQQTLHLWDVSQDLKEKAVTACPIKVTAENWKS